MNHQEEKSHLMVLFLRYCEENPAKARDAFIRTRWHEAGHALAGVLLLGGIDYVSVEPVAVPNANGKIMVRTGFVEYLSSSRINLKTLETWAINKMAGHASEVLAGVDKKELTNTRVDGENLREVYGYEDDEEQLRHDAVQAGFPEEETSALICRGRAAAKELLEKNFDALKTISNRLQTKKRLSGDEVRHCIEQAGHPLTGEAE
jgi:ATP-dependent Zn protease